MKKIYVILLFILLFAQTDFAQKKARKRAVKPSAPKTAAQIISARDAPLLRSAKARSEEFGQLLMAGEYEKVYSFIHPKVRDAAGGKEAFIDLLKNSMSSMEAEGFKIISMEAAEPKKIVRIGEQMFTIIPSKLKMKTPQNILILESYDIGIWDAKAQIWLLIGGGSISGRDNMQRFFPEAVDKLEFPKVAPPYPYTGQ